MTKYKIINTSVHRNTGILKVEVLDSISSNTMIYEIEDKPEIKFTLKGSRMLYNDDGTIRNERVLLVYKPDFDLTQLAGKNLISSESPV